MNAKGRHADFVFLTPTFSSTGSACLFVIRNCLSFQQEEECDWENECLCARNTSTNRPNCCLKSELHLCPEIEFQYILECGDSYAICRDETDVSTHCNTAPDCPPQPPIAVSTKHSSSTTNSSKYQTFLHHHQQQ